MAVKNLRCKECAAEYELGANFFCAECFGPLEVVYDHSDLNADEAKRRIQTGSLGIWRYSDFLPFVDQPKDPLEPVGLDARGHAPLERILGLVHEGQAVRVVPYADGSALDVALGVGAG